MIKKPLEIPLIILILEALLRRIAKDHPKRSLIEQDLAKRMAGYKGELSMKYHLTFLDPQKHLIFHSLRLMNNNYAFQMDILILTTRYILILETKNIIGTVLFESHFDQFIRTLNGKEEGFLNPLSQVKLQKHRLKKWLMDHKIRELPIESFVCFTNPQTIIRADSRVNASRSVIHSHNLSSKIEEMDRSHPEQILTKKELSKLSRSLLKKHCDEDINILERYKITPEEILTGVQCPSCMEISMIRKRGCWICLICRNKSKDAHLAALEDRLLIFGPSITHRQFREFLGLQSDSITSKIISSLALQHCGSKYQRTYTLPKLNQKTKQPL
ncbi:NERD domain-containing protein [Bacillus tianshenii]|uniref:nuclease-related domain-containing protein n=1 Tax=Sutcliffiella tianshenii TaxID=1463404 RepID=UPI001CD376A0|nr:nuclease-related domain-containing protein [Bacillus tianshenii]MCA1318683.1 NERD domain-containing protein [Bacillus tianshenii]